MRTVLSTPERAVLSRFADVANLKSGLGRWGEVPTFVEREHLIACGQQRTRGARKVDFRTIGFGPFVRRPFGSKVR